MTVLQSNPGVVIVNYNAPELSLRAALSVLGDAPNANVVIVDNQSTDGSLAYFENVVSGKKPVAISAPAAFRAIPLADVSGLGARVIAKPDLRAPVPLTFLANTENEGFAAGCNVGLRLLSKTVDPDWFLLLNPDAVVARKAISAFAARLADRRVGLCGASVMREAAPHAFQAAGGAQLNPLTLLGRNIAEGAAFANAPAPVDVERRLTYPLGAAIAFRRDCYERLGGLDERFFLYYEEADWAIRSRRFYSIGWARDAVVLHRHGAIAGSRRAEGGRSAFSDYHMARSRMLFARKHRPMLIPVVLAVSAAQSIRRLSRDRGDAAAALWAGARLAFYPQHKKRKADGVRRIRWPVIASRDEPR